MTTYRTRSEQLTHEIVFNNRQQQAVLDNALQNRLKLLSYNNDLDRLTKLTIECELLSKYREETAKLNGLLF